MADPTIARNYGDVASLVKANQNSILEVNPDGSIRAQNIGEKIGNLGLRIIGRYNTTKTEKDAKVALAIQNLYQKTGQTENSFYAPKNNRDFDRFFRPQSLQKRVATKEIKGAPGIKLTQAINNKQEESLKVPAQKIFLAALADTFSKLSIAPEFRQDSQALDGLAATYRTASRYSKQESADATFAQLNEDLKGVGLQLGRGPLEEFNITNGVVDWVQKNAPQELDRYSPN